MKKKKRSGLGFCVLAAVFALLLLSGVPRVRRDIRRNSVQSIRQAVIRSAVECYAVEGTYPENLAYLENHYGLRVNHEDFVITYEAYASNQLPDVRVLVKGEG